MRSTRPCTSPFFFSFVTREPVYMAGSQVAILQSLQPGAPPPFPAGMPAWQRCAGGCWSAKGAAGDVCAAVTRRRLIHKSPLTFSGSPFMTAGSSSACFPTRCPAGEQLKRPRTVCCVSRTVVREKSGLLLVGEPVYNQTL